MKQRSRPTAAAADDEQSRSPSPVGNSVNQQQLAATAADPKQQTAAALQSLKTAPTAPSPFAAAAQQPLASIPASPAATAGSPTATDGNSSGRSQQQHQGDAPLDTEQQRQQQQAAHDGVALLAAALEAQSPDSPQQQQESDAATEATAAADGGEADADAGAPVDPTLLANFEAALSVVMLRPVAVSEANDLRSDLEALTNFDIELVNKSRRGPVGSSSKFRGVTQHRRTRRWEAHIWDSKKQVYLGGFDNEVQAAKAHDVMAIKTRGPKTIINFKVVVYEGLLEWLCNSKLTKEATISALRKSSRRISSGKKRNRNSYTISPRSSPTTPRNHSSSSSGAAAAALQSLANAQLPPLHDSPVSAGTTSNARHHQGALDAALAAAAAAAAGISTSAAAAAGFGREGGRGSRSSSRAGRGDAFGLGVLAGGVPKHKGGSDRVPYIQVDSSGVVVNMPRTSPGILDLPAPPVSHSSGTAGPNHLAGMGLGDLGRLGFSRGIATSSSLGLSSGLGLSSSLGLSGLGGGLGLGLNDDDMMPQLPPAAVLEAVLERGGMYDNKFEHGLAGMDQGLGIGGSSGLVGVTTFRACPGDALGLKGIGSQGLSMLGLGGGVLDPLGSHSGVSSRHSSLLLLQQRLQQQQQNMPAPPNAAAAAAVAAKQQALLAQQRQQQQLHQLQLQQQQQQMQIQHQLQLQQQRLQLQQQHLQQQQQHQQALSSAAAAAAADAATAPPSSLAANLRDITSVHNPNNNSSSSNPMPATQLNTQLMGLPESDLVASDALLISHADVASTSAAAAATADSAGVLVSSGITSDSFAALAELECSMAAAASLPLMGTSDLFFDSLPTSTATAAVDHAKQLQHDPTGSMTANNSVEGLPATSNNSNANTAIAAAAAAAAAAAEAAAMMEASRAVQRELAIRREAGLALLMGGRVGKARV